MPSRTELISSYERLARHMVKRVRHSSLDSDDFFQSAMVAVIEAVDTFKPSLKVPMAAHVINHIKWALCGDITGARHHTQTAPFRFNDLCDPSPAAGDDSDSHTELWDAIDQLPAGDAAILIGFYGLTGRRQLRRELCEAHRQTKHQISASTTRSTRALRAALMP